MPSNRFSLNRIFSGGLTAFAVYSGGMVLAYCSQIILAYVAGVDSYGLYAYVLAWIVPLAYIAACGFDMGLMRFLPVYLSQQDWGRIKGLLSYAQRRVAVVGVAIAGVAVAGALSTSMPRERMVAFVIGFTMVPVLALLRVRCAAARGLGAVTGALLPDRVLREGTLILLVIGASVGFGWNIHAPGIVLAMAVATVFGLLATVVALGAQMPKPLIHCTTYVFESATWRSVALPLLLIGALEVLMNRIGVITLGWLADNKSAGVYSLAFNIAMVVTLPRVALNTLFAPAIASHYSRRDQASLQLLVTRTSVWSVSASVAIGIVLFVLAGWLMDMFDRESNDGVAALRILVVGQMIAAAAGSQLYVMTMSGHERAAAWQLAGFTLLSALLAWYGVLASGIIGAAVAGMVSLVLWNACMSLFLRRKLGLVPGVLAALTGRGTSDVEGIPSVASLFGEFRKKFRR